MTRYWQSIEQRDRSFDGVFVYAVHSTKIYCRPSCPSRLPKQKNVSYFDKAEAAEAAGFRACLRCRPSAERHPEAALIEQACRFIEARAGAGFSLADLSKHMGYSPFHLQRTFQAVTGVTPRGYGEAGRVASLKAGLRAKASVTESLYDAGFSSSSRVYEKSDAQLGMTPATYGRAGAGAKIEFSTAGCHLGRVLVAETGRGVCSIALGDSDEALEQNLRAEFSAAMVTRGEGLHLAQVLGHLQGVGRLLELPLDIQATAFQRLVWQELQRIPFAETRSYAEVAERIGKPRAVRAVATACASNPVALAIPCHRVVRGTGELAGYRWGLERKRALLKQERQ